MSLLTKLNEDMKQVMRNKDKDRLSVIRMIKASLQNEAIQLGVDHLKPKDELTILSRELKQRNDALNEFKAAGRDDLVSKIEVEIDILHDYMPDQLTDEELDQIVHKTIQELEATSKQDFGKV